MENDLPPATKYALNASSRLAEDIRSLAEADQTNEEREKAAS
jgi:hypothetical protein